MHILIEFNKQKWFVSISYVCNELAEHIRWITNMILIFNSCMEGTENQLSLFFDDFLINSSKV